MSNPLRMGRVATSFFVPWPANFATDPAVMGFSRLPQTGDTRRWPQLRYMRIRKVRATRPLRPSTVKTVVVQGFR